MPKYVVVHAAKKEIPAGSPLAQGAFTMRTVWLDELPTEAIVNTVFQVPSNQLPTHWQTFSSDRDEKLWDKQAASDIEKGDILLKSHLTEPDPFFESE